MHLMSCWLVMMSKKHSLHYQHVLHNGYLSGCSARCASRRNVIFKGFPSELEPTSLFLTIQLEVNTSNIIVLNILAKAFPFSQVFPLFIITGLTLTVVFPWLSGLAGLKTLKIRRTNTKWEILNSNRSYKGVRKSSLFNKLKSVDVAKVLSTGLC